MEPAERVTTTACKGMNDEMSTKHGDMSEEWGAEKAGGATYIRSEVHSEICS